MPKPYPQEFRDDVVAVARRGQAPLTQVAADFGISIGCLKNWMRAAEVADGTRDGVTSEESVCGHNVMYRRVSARRPPRCIVACGFGP